MRPKFFESAADWRRWLAAHHSSAAALLVGLHKRDSGRPSMTWPESVDEALCFGWIDGVRRSIDDKSYAIRFSVRKDTSVWSKVNQAKVAALTAAGRMAPAGLRKFKLRRESRSGVYSYEQQGVKLDVKWTEEFKSHPDAWAFFQRQPDWYVRKAIWWLARARQPATRRRRFAKLIDASRRQKQFDDK